MELGGGKSPQMQTAPVTLEQLLGDNWHKFWEASRWGVRSLSPYPAYLGYWGPSGNQREDMVLCRLGIILECVVVPLPRPICPWEPVVDRIRIEEIVWGYTCYPTQAWFLFFPPENRSHSYALLGMAPKSKK